MTDEVLACLISQPGEYVRPEKGSGTGVCRETLFEKIVYERSIVLHLVTSSIFDILNISTGRTMSLPIGEILTVSFQSMTGGKNMEIKLQKPGESMLDDLHLPLQVVVGAVQLSVRDILDLEAGMSCEVGLPENKLVNLYLGGECIADAELLMDEKNIKLKILSVYLQQEEESSDNSMNAGTVCATEQ